MLDRLEKHYFVTVAKKRRLHYFVLYIFIFFEGILFSTYITNNFLNSFLTHFLPKFVLFKIMQIYFNTKVRLHHITNTQVVQDECG